MNNLVFNTVASRLLTTITNDTLTVSGSVDIAGGTVEIANTVVTVTGTVAVGSASVEITNDAVTVTGTVAIDSASVEITNTVLTVTGAVTVLNDTLTVDGTVEITNASVTVTGTVGIDGTASVEITNDAVTVDGTVEITNATVTVSGAVTISGHTITSLNTTVVDSQTGVIFDNTDISEITMGTFFIYNGGAQTFSVTVQLSPTADDANYVDDPDNKDIEVGSNAKLLIVLSKYGHYARLQYNATADASFTAYFNGQM